MDTDEKITKVIETLSEINIRPKTLDVDKRSKVKIVNTTMEHLLRAFDEYDSFDDRRFPHDLIGSQLNWANLQIKKLCKNPDTSTYEDSLTMSDIRDTIHQLSVYFDEHRSLKLRLYQCEEHIDHLRNKLREYPEFGDKPQRWSFKEEKR